jgi:DNA-binding XRE family transcriptional regulator
MSIERGRTNPSVLLALKIAATLNAPVQDVFTVEMMQETVAQVTTA